MGMVKTDEQNYINIANAIREKTGSADTFTPGEMDDAILSIPTGGAGLTNDVKQALLQIAEKVAYIDDQGQTYYEALFEALYPLESISAVYIQSGEVYTDNTLNDLKANLIVTATYDDDSTAVVTDYTLSGTLTAGTNTITVSYHGKTDTFSVIVTAPLYSIPDFVEQTITNNNKSLTVKKENGVYTVSGSYAGVGYIYPDGTLTTLRSNIAWFETISGESLLYKVKDISWNNPTSTAISLDCKLSRSDQDGNIYSASFAMAANGSGISGETQYAPASGTISTGRQISGLAIQFSSNPGSSNNVSATFKLELYVAGVRYL